MVEKFARDFGAVVDGRKSWTELLRGIADEVGGKSSGLDRESRRRR